MIRVRNRLLAAALGAVIFASFPAFAGELSPQVVAVQVNSDSVEGARILGPS